MKEKILMRKLVAFAKKIDCHRHGRDQEYALDFCYLSPKDTVGRCYKCRTAITNRHAGHDIVISSYWIRRYPSDINGFKSVLLHELAHTNRHITGHGLDFRRACRRLGVMTYWKMSDKRL